MAEVIERQINLRLKDILTELAVFEFDAEGKTDMDMPFPAIIRAGYKGGAQEHPEKTFRFTFPRYGVLKMTYRDYEFTPTEQYGRVLAVRNNRPLKGKW